MYYNVLQNQNPQTPDFTAIKKAGYGNRTRLLGLGSRCTTDVLTLHPVVKLLIFYHNANSFYKRYDAHFLYGHFPVFAAARSST